MSGAAAVGAGDAGMDPALLLSLDDAGLGGARGWREWWWELAGRRLFRLSFHNWFGVRRWLLRVAGAEVGADVKTRPTARIRHPGNLSIGAGTAIGDHAVVTCVAPIRLGERSTVSQYAQLCSGSRDCSVRERTIVGRPITIGADVWLAADVFVFPGVTIGARSVVGARSTVRRSLPGGMVCAGDDARPVGPRAMRGEGGGGSA